MESEGRVTKRKKWIIGLSAAGVASAYFAYRVYRSDSLAALIDLRRRLHKSLEGYSRSLLLGSEFTNTVTEDLRDFLLSDADDIPQSLKQLTKLAKSKEVTEATSLLAEAAVRGALVGGSKGSAAEGASGAPAQDFLERIMAALTTERGSNLVSLAINMACQSSMKAFYEYSGGRNTVDRQQPNLWQQILEFGSTPQGEKLYSSCIATFVREGMKVYVGSLEGVNAWEDFLGSLCKSERQAAVDRLTRVFVNELVTCCFKRARRAPTPAPSKKNSGWNWNAERLGQSYRGESKSSKSAMKQGMLVEDVVLQEDSSAPEADVTAYLAVAQQLMHPEVRGLLTAVVGTAAFQAVRSLLFTAREMVTGAPGAAPVISTRAGSGQLQQLSSRALGTLLLFVFMPVIIFLAGRRAALGGAGS